MWTLAATDPGRRDEDAAAIAAALQALVGVVPSLRSLVVTRNAEAIEGNSDLVLEAVFDDRAGLDAYLQHPAHLDAVAVVRARVSGRAAIDV